MISIHGMWGICGVLGAIPFSSKSDANATPPKAARQVEKKTNERFGTVETLEQILDAFNRRDLDAITLRRVRLTTAPHAARYPQGTVRRLPRISTLIASTSPAPRLVDGGPRRALPVRLAAVSKARRAPATNRTSPLSRVEARPMPAKTSGRRRCVRWSSSWRSPRDRSRSESGRRAGRA